MSKTEPPSEGTTSSPLSPPNNGSLQLVPLGMIYSTLSLSLIGVVGNALIIAATVSSPSLQKRCNILIATLACADLVVCIYLVSEDLRTAAQTPLGSMMLKRFWIHVECYRFSNTGVPSSGSIQIDVTVGVGCL
ncbi:hypothetical protein ANCCEY_10437 [Ancylostoma ceylanicum]|uniref:G-protein coupled receptors family 1 profile domain-containing protein n=1 Tax=Ancylostoma ceylanicum TaxID=53326 RepID=A0A0D6LH23_9BILA|nr:hypothetical protein ANCCEY_10437 [Ancylostoma ceylanicum]